MESRAATTAAATFLAAIPLLLGWIGCSLTGGAPEAVPAAKLQIATAAGSWLPHGKGYLARPCGFDARILDLVRGRGAGGAHLLYVDAESGNDQRGDGSPRRPYKSIQEAIDVAAEFNDGRESVIAIHGVFHESLVLTAKNSGRPEYYVRGGFQYPERPSIITGWDRNGNGQYPPYDKGDVAVLDGANTLDMAVTSAASGVSNFEVAHLTIRNYGNVPGAHDIGVFQFRGPGHGDQTHICIHDVEIRHVITEVPNYSGTIVMNLFGGQGRRFRHIAMENNLVDEYGGYFARGGGEGPYRFVHNTLVMHGVSKKSRKVDAASAGVTGWKMWGPISDVEIADNVVDGNPRAWEPDSHAVGVGVCQGSQHWTIRGNTFLDLDLAVMIQPDAGPEFYRDRTVNDIVIDGNVYRNTYRGWRGGASAIDLQGGAFQRATAENIAITNNFLSSTTPWNCVINCTAGNDEGPQPGRVVIAGNTIQGPCTHRWIKQAIHISEEYWAYEVREFLKHPYPQQHFVIKNNAFADIGEGSRGNLGLTYAPTDLVADGNVYDPSAGFIWNNSPRATLAAWQEATGQDAHSAACSPQFVDVAHGDLDLAPDDACASGTGVDISAFAAVDIDGDRRSSDHPAAGADVPGTLR
jgi:hypothetical protein